MIHVLVVQEKNIRSVMGNKKSISETLNKISRENNKQIK
jgi:hypothetical protein